MKKFKIEYFTDPLCCWSWGMEPQVRKMRYLLRDQIEISYIMGGLIRDWDHFSDQMNDVHKPSQLGPIWAQAKHMTGQPLDENIWVKNPVDTSYLSCMAVKAAENYSNVAGEAMLRKLREAVMLKQKNIGEIAVILEIADDLQQEQILDKEQFKDCLFSEEVSKLFREDLNLVKIRGITRFPSMLITCQERTVQITGYRPFQVLLDAFRLLDPDLEPEEEINTANYMASWAYLTEREIMEVNKDKASRNVQV